MSSAPPTSGPRSARYEERPSRGPLEVPFVAVRRCIAEAWRVHGPTVVGPCLKTAACVRLFADFVPGIHPESNAEAHGVSRVQVDVLDGCWQEIGRLRLRIRHPQGVAPCPQSTKCRLPGSVSDGRRPHLCAGLQLYRKTDERAVYFVRHSEMDFSVGSAPLLVCPPHEHRTRSRACHDCTCRERQRDLSPTACPFQRRTCYRRPRPWSCATVTAASVVVRLPASSSAE